MSEPASDSWRKTVRRRLFVAGSLLALWASPLPTYSRLPNHTETPP